MASSPVLPPNRHVEFKKGGWGAALLTTAAAIATFLTAFYIHKQTYRHPTDLMMRTYPHNDAAHGAPSAEASASGQHGATGGSAAPATTPAPSGGH
ncbi:MAG: hypothetical protein ACXW61_12800 [Gemmatirosa sp.]